MRERVTGQGRESSVGQCTEFVQVPPGPLVKIWSGVSEVRDRVVGVSPEPVGQYEPGGDHHAEARPVEAVQPAEARSERHLGCQPRAAHACRPCRRSCAAPALAAPGPRVKQAVDDQVEPSATAATNSGLSGRGATAPNLVTFPASELGGAC